MRHFWKDFLLLAKQDSCHHSIATSYYKTVKYVYSCKTLSDWRFLRQLMLTLRLELYAGYAEDGGSIRPSYRPRYVSSHPKYLILFLPISLIYRRPIIHHHHHHHHHISFMELGHLLTRYGLTCPEVSSKVYHDSFCQLGSSISFPWIFIHLLCNKCCMQIKHTYIVTVRYTYLTYLPSMIRKI